MVVHWWKQGGSPFRMAMNGLGAVATGITTLVVLVAKFVEGAWITAVLVAFMILAMRMVKRHYDRVARETDFDRPITPSEVTTPVVVLPIDRWSRITEQAMTFALSMSDDIRCVHVQIGEETDQFCLEWEEKIASPLRTAGKCVPKLITVISPFRYVLQPVVDYVLSVECETENHKVCVLVPELVVRHWWEGLLHNRRVKYLS
jgi:hypothetical protein